jgi:hypothetical protein
LVYPVALVAVPAIPLPIVLALVPKTPLLYPLVLVAMPKRPLPPELESMPSIA